MGIDLSQAETRKVRDGSKFLNVCKHEELDEIIRIVHQEKVEYQKEETYKLQQILKEIEFQKKLP